MSYQKVTGPLMANSHPGSYCGQDAYSDMLVTDENILHRKRSVRPTVSTEHGRFAELYARPTSNVNRGGGDLIETTEGNEILRFLQQTYGEEEVLQWGVGVLDILQQTEVLQHGVYEGCVQSKTEDWQELDDNSLPRKELVAGWALRDMWEREKCRRSPQGRKSAKQQSGEFAEIMQKLSHQSTPSGKALFDMWSKGERIWLLQQTLYSIQKIRKPSLGEWKGGDEMMDVSTNKTVVRRLTPL